MDSAIKQSSPSHLPSRFRSLPSLPDESKPRELPSEMDGKVQCWRLAIRRTIVQIDCENPSHVDDLGRRMLGQSD